MTRLGVDAASRVQIVEASVEDLRQLEATAKRFADSVRRLRWEGFDVKGGVTLMAIVLRDDRIPTAPSVPPSVDIGPAPERTGVQSGILHTE